MRDRAPIDGTLPRDLDALTADRDDRLDQRAEAARAQSRAQIASRYALNDGVGLRRADEHDVA